jgi:hypothetical protein
VERNREWRNVYVGANPRKPGSPPMVRASAEDVEIAFYHFVECDGAEAAELIQDALLRPSFTVCTGQTPHMRFHAFWELETATRDMSAWSERQAALREHFRGDQVKDPPRVMRLAGTINYPAAHKVARG